MRCWVEGPVVILHFCKKDQPREYVFNYLLTLRNFYCQFTFQLQFIFSKRLFNFQQKFFDSGDYQMAKQRPGNLAAPFKAPAAPAKLPTGDAIPTPETVPLRKTSIIQPKYTTPSQTSQPCITMNPHYNCKKLILKNTS